MRIASIAFAKSWDELAKRQVLHDNRAMLDPRSILEGWIPDYHYVRRLGRNGGRTAALSLVCVKIPAWIFQNGV